MKKKLRGFQMKTMLKPMLAMGVVMVSLLITATSCDKKPAASGNSGGQRGSLSLVSGSGAYSFVKIRGNTVYISAAGLASKVTPLSDADDAKRSFNDLIAANNKAATNSTNILYLSRLFDVIYPGTTAAMVFVNRAHVTKDSIILRAFNDCSEDKESADSALAKAAGGGICRRYDDDDDAILFFSMLGTVFDNAKTSSHARGIMRCYNYIARWDSINRKYLPVVNDTVVFNSGYRALCDIGVVNNGLGERIEIDNAWVGDSGSTTEVELYALAIDVTEKNIQEFSSASGFNRHEFASALDNAAFKKILEKSYWADLKFKVKIVTAAAF